MNKSEKVGYLLGMILGLVFWVGLIGYLIYELVSRIFGDGDPFPVLTTILLIAIISKLQSVNISFREIVDWMKK